MNNLPCPCGREHTTLTKSIYIGEDADIRLKAFLLDEYKSNPNGIIICDKNTYNAAINLINLLSDICRAVILEIDTYHAEMRYIEAAKRQTERISDYSYLIAAGTGTIHDITRIVACEFDKGFISYPTAPSVDGFMSAISPVTIGGMKKTLQGKPPDALFANAGIIKKSPRRLVASGVGDLIGKYITLADWRVSNELFGEYICEKIFGMVKTQADKVVGLILNYKKSKNEEDYYDLTLALLEGLITSGLCITYAKSSRPASGAEHHIAHFIEMGILYESDNLHGENVGVGSIICAKIYRSLLNCEAQNIEYIKNDGNDEKAIKNIFGALSDEIKNEYRESCDITYEMLQEKFDIIKEIIKNLPTREDFIEIMSILDGVTDIKTNMKSPCNTENLENELFACSQYVRNRFTIQKLINNIYVTESR